MTPDSGFAAAHFGGLDLDTQLQTLNSVYLVSSILGLIVEPLLRKLVPPAGLCLSAVSAHRQQGSKGIFALARLLLPPLFEGLWG